MPQVVVTDPVSGLKAVAYGHVCAVAVAAVQELKETHDTEMKLVREEHNKEVDRMTKEIEELKEMVKQLAGLIGKK